MSRHIWHMHPAQRIHQVRHESKFGVDWGCWYSCHCTHRQYSCQRLMGTVWILCYISNLLRHLKKKFLHTSVHFWRLDLYCLIFSRSSLFRWLFLSHVRLASDVTLSTMICLSSFRIHLFFEFALFLEDFTSNFSQLLFFLLPLLPLLLNDFSSLLFSLWWTSQHSRPSPSFISRDVPETQNMGW